MAESTFSSLLLCLLNNVASNYCLPVPFVAAGATAANGVSGNSPSLHPTVHRSIDWWSKKRKRADYIIIIIIIVITIDCLPVDSRYACVQLRAALSMCTQTTTTTVCVCVCVCITTMHNNNMSSSSWRRVCVQKEEGGRHTVNLRV